MFIVTGTKRSGTSMWMQILRSAGIPIHGEAFPRDWGDVIHAANPEGFYESSFRAGINFRTNPHPKTGEYVNHIDSRGTAVKVFVPGLVRSDMAFIEKVVITMRDWREYDGSLKRLYAMERANRPGAQELPPMPHVDPTVEWWSETYALLSDALTRRYPFHMVAYETTLSDPAAVIPETLEWLGVGDVDAALAAVKPALRSHDRTVNENPVVESSLAEVLDELYARVRDRRGLDDAFVDRLNATHEALMPRIVEEMKRVREAQKERRVAAEVRAAKMTAAAEGES